MLRIGIDIGSTTVKMAVIDEHGTTCFTRYERHNAAARSRLVTMLRDLRSQVGDADVAVNLTGSVGMGLSEQTALPFVQEVVAASHYVQERHPAVQSLIDIGGEDAKVVFFRDGRAADLRMNGNCAGGTGAFIDQMAILLGVETAALGQLADAATTVHPIASRCGVFAKTDVQNLIARGVSREDIAASVFHAVAVQTVVTLAHGQDITSPVLLCGGPLTFIPALRRAFADYLKLSEATDFVLPTDSHLIPALGAALSASAEKTLTLDALIEVVESSSREDVKLCSCEEGVAQCTSSPLHTSTSSPLHASTSSPLHNSTSSQLPPIFQTDEERTLWRKSLQSGALTEQPLCSGHQRLTLGIDSGSTTTKVVALDEAGHLVFHFYAPNSGDPIGTARRGLELLQEQAKEAGAAVEIVGSCSTGYGEDLLKACFGLDHGIVETIAHYMAARELAPDVSFILDIGGQDMKAMFISGGVIDRIEINEACSSGCGSFIETFARSLGYGLEDFAALACTAHAPYDLGTRCTVFMNSKVKQALREGASVGDIAAGLAYSVVKNCLYKVLRLKSTAELGRHIVVQGGTMKNDAVVRAFEQITGCRVHRSAFPELMGAVGCARYAREAASSSTTLETLLQSAVYETSERQCHGCENQCRVTVYQFAGGRRYYSGNRCESVFTNKGRAAVKGENAYAYKLRLLFDRPCEVEKERGTVGLPRALNMYEEYPFWHALFTTCGIRPVLSAPSTMPHYEACARQVMSDNICFPAKLVHSHIEDLVRQGVERIFMPYVVFERPNGGQNSYNCPIVTAYSEVVKGSGHGNIPLDTPAITFKDAKLLQRQCVDYLCTTWGISRLTAERAFRTAVTAYDDYARQISDYNRDLLQRSRQRTDADRLTVLLAGRPYHADPLIQHKLADIIAAQGVDVLTDDIVQGLDSSTSNKEGQDADVAFFSQWAFPHRILKAATWAARQPNDLQFMEMTSFGCGPDAFLTDEVRDLLRRSGKPMALLKLDDVSNMGSVKLRVRSVIESLRLSRNTGVSPVTAAASHTADKPANHERRKLLVPFFTPFISPLIPSFLAYLGYDAECLPISDRASCEAGLRHANNEVCYPATLIVGDIVKAFTSGRYDPQHTAVVMTQTGGQCRATNYVAVIRKALREAGFPDVQVLSLATSSGLDSDEQRLHLPWLKALPIAVTTLFFSDSLAKYYYAALPREQLKGAAAALLQHYLTAAQPLVATGNRAGLWTLLERAADDFDAAVAPPQPSPCGEGALQPLRPSLCTKDARRSPTPSPSGESWGGAVGAVGIVGEIFLKFHPFAQLHLTEHLTARGYEVIPPMLTDFFLQAFVNARVNKAHHLGRHTAPAVVQRLLYNMVWRHATHANKIGRRFRYFRPFEPIDAKADEAKRVVSLCAQFGEGWLLPGEVLSMARGGVTHVISLQPFGCIANHIVAKGIEKRLKAAFPALQFLTLDFDSSVSDVNISNRLLLFLDSLRPSA